ncbi:glycosyl transferase [Merismopedia glauca CCAP 1448/3]|uniref:4,4'-diaponeurosporenoate glycosyltransferase n=2 Tax=Merismopedia TaxID=53402 RepID=A0A2T1C4Z2_9CYAN|nr:glycosyl transferase [Merismopedia glauca CCAP 1448/3]
MKSKEAVTFESRLSSTSYFCKDRPLVEISPDPECEVCAIVPVRNEAALLTQTLISLLEQVDLQGQPLAKNRYEIIVFANNCTDESAQIARDFASQHPDLVLHVVERTLPASEAYIGRVRQMLMDEACRRLLSINRDRGVIASTDGDTRVSPTWIAATLSEIAQGADAVGGKILTDRHQRANLEPHARNCFLRGAGYYSLIVELEAYIDPDPFDGFPRHNHHYGASLAVTAQMYQRVGGMPAVRTPEDVAFYQALVRADARFRHSLLVKVTTAARDSGRTAEGFANQLRMWTEMGQKGEEFRVETPLAVESRLRARRRLRKIWQQHLSGYLPKNHDFIRVSKNLGINHSWLRSQLAQSQTFGALWEQVEQRQQTEGIWQQRWSLVPIKQAIADLRVRVNSLRQQRQVPSLVVNRPSPQISWKKGA